MSLHLLRLRAERAYVWSRLPVLHTVIIVIELLMVARLIARYNALVAARPVFTMMVTNAILGGIADTVAQSITAYRESPVSRRRRDSESDIELDEKAAGLVSHDELLPRAASSRGTAFDFERLCRFAAYGFCMAPVTYKWFGLLERLFPITSKSAFVPALKRVAFDQIIFAPFGIGIFFTAMTLAEGGGRRAVSAKMRDMYLPTLKANYVVWPMVQVVNFRLMPVQFQLPFVSTVGIAWTAYLSLSNASEDDSIIDRENVRLD